MLTLHQRDKHSTTSGGRQKGGPSQPVQPAPRNTSNQPSQGARDPPAPVGWSPSSGAPQAAYPLGSSTQQQQQQQQQQQGVNAHTQPGDSFFPGGFILPGSHNNSSPRSSRSSSVSSHHRPQPLGNGFAQQQQQQQQPPPPPPADPGLPNVDKDEYARVSTVSFLLLIYFRMEVLRLVCVCGPRWERAAVFRGTVYVLLFLTFFPSSTHL